MEVAPKSIPQKNLVGTETTTPELSEVRKLFSTKIPTTDVTAEQIKFWLQAPPRSTETKLRDGPGKADNDCEQRAERVASALKPLSRKYQPKSFESSTITPLAKQWEGVDTTLRGGIPVMIKAPDTFIGGPMSVFKSGTSHHVVLFLAYGEDSTGEPFYVGYDPDISATEDTRTAWKIADAAETNNKVISDMILGAGTKGFGPLCRKYYVNKKYCFPKIDRFKGLV